MTTRAVHLQRTFDVLQLSDEAQVFLRDDKKVTNIGKLAMLQESQVEGWASSTTSLTESDVNEISKFKAWYLAWTKNRDNDLSNFMGVFTEDMWDTYFPPGEDVVQDDEGLHGKSEGVEDRNNFKVKADLKQFLRFTGLIDEYVPWKCAMRAVAMAQGLGELLEDSYTVPEEGGEDYKVYHQKNALLHSALMMVMAEGTAILKVEKFHPTADGRGAWMALRDWYEGQGSNESVAKRALNSSSFYWRQGHQQQQQHWQPFCFPHHPPL